MWLFVILGDWPEHVFVRGESGEWRGGCVIRSRLVRAESLCKCGFVQEIWDGRGESSVYGVNLKRKRVLAFEPFEPWGIPRYTTWRRKRA